MSRFTNKVSDFIAITAIIGWFKCLMVLIIFIGIIKACVTDDPDPMDHSINKDQYIVELLDVTDSAGNGFRVHYATAYPVTSERYSELLSRPALKEAYRRLQQDAPRHFGGSLLDTDIYDFAAFARNYDTTSAVHIDCIFVTGREKIALYEQPNPDLPDGATSIRPGTEQGLQWIGHRDIYYREGKEDRLYRYWKCRGMREYSSTDERFIHFTEKERIR